MSLEMDKIVLVRAVLMAARRQEEVRRDEWRRKQTKRRRRALVRRKIQLRLAFMLMVMGAIFPQREMRLLWTKERSSHWWDEIVNSRFTLEDWLANFRMSRDTYVYLCEQLRSSITKHDTTMRKAITVEKRVALTLWFLATGVDYRTVSHLFGVSKSSVCVVTKQVCSAIVTCLLPKYIHIPSGSALTENVEAFKTQYGFPQCVGAVDGSHIPIVSPHQCPAD